MSFRPTGEQTQISDAFRAGHGLVIEAGAGSGKTSTLRMLASMLRTPYLYLAFNKAIKEEAARTFPNGKIACKTAHGLAWQREYRARMARIGRQKPTHVAAILGIHRPELIRDDHHPLTPARLAALTLRMVAEFCKSADDELTLKHTPILPGFEAPATLHRLGTVLLPFARKAWREAIDPNGALQFDFAHFLKLFQLSKPHLPYDVIMYDECQPPGTVVETPTGPVKIEDLRKGDMVCSYDRSTMYLSRRGSRVAGISARHFDGELITIKAETLSTRYTPNHICLAKTGPAFEGKTLVYVMKRGQSWRVGVTSGHHGAARRVSGPASRMHEERADAIWVLAAFDDRSDALILEEEVSARYGLPQMVFRSGSTNSIPQEKIDAFWARMGDLTERAERCLAAYGRDAQYPLAIRALSETGTRVGMNLYTRATTIRACNLMDGMMVLDAGKVMSRRVPKVSRDDDAYTSVTVGREAYTGDVWSMTVENTHTYVGDGIITHNCQDANPVVLDIVQRQTHARIVAVGDRAQAINTWNGAIDAMDRFGGKRFKLSKSFRFGDAIAREANRWLDHLALSDLRLVGHTVASEVRSLDAADLVLCRSNSGTIGEIMALRDEGVSRIGLAGGAADIKRMADAAVLLKDGNGCDHPDLAAFRDWDELCEYVDDPDNNAGDLARFVKLVNRYGHWALIFACRDLVDERKADVVVSTAHKAKGLEARRVRVSWDFQAPEFDDAGRLVEPLDPEELKLAYVTVTRAKEQLDRGPLAYIDQLDQIPTLI